MDGLGDFVVGGLACVATRVDRFGRSFCLCAMDSVELPLLLLFRIIFRGGMEELSDKVITKDR